MSAFVYFFLQLALAPLYLGMITKTKALFAGRWGAPWFQGYYDLWKLFHKATVYSRSTTWVFRVGPMIGFSSVMMAISLLPLNGNQALFGFPGDLFVFGYLLAMARFFTVLAALDTGSAFEGMGASREVWLAVLTEPSFFLSLAGLAIITKQVSMSGFLSLLTGSEWQHFGAPIIIFMGALFIILLAENARIPVDDPTTHLELTMIHEVMVLDHSGPDLGFIVYTSALKLVTMGTLICNVLAPIRFGNPWLDGMIVIIGMLILSVAIGVVESTMARLRLLRVPQLLVTAGILALLSLLLMLRS